MWPFREDPGKWRRLSGMENPAGMTPYEQVRDEQEAEEVWARSRGRRWLEIAPAGLIYHTPERTQTFPWDVVTALKEGAFELGWAVRCTFNCPVINPTVSNRHPRSEQRRTILPSSTKRTRVIPGRCHESVCRSSTRS